MSKKSSIIFLLIIACSLTSLNIFADDYNNVIDVYSSDNTSSSFVISNAVSNTSPAVINAIAEKVPSIALKYNVTEMAVNYLMHMYINTKFGNPSFLTITDSYIKINDYKIQNDGTLYLKYAEVSKSDFDKLLQDEVTKNINRIKAAMLSKASAISTKYNITVKDTKILADFFCKTRFNISYYILTTYNDYIEISNKLDSTYIIKNDGTLLHNDYEVTESDINYILSLAKSNNLGQTY